MGFVFAAMACACRGRWIGAGILVALAVLTQQFALLVAAPLFVLAPAKGRISYAAAALTTAALVVLPILMVTSGNALRAITLGTGDNVPSAAPWSGSCALRRTARAALPGDAHAVSVALAWWVSRRLGPAALQPATLVSVMAISLGLRLVFEENLFPYYLMALAVSLVLLDVVRGYVRSSTIAWLTAVTLVFCFFRNVSFESLGLGGYVNALVPLLFLAPALALLVFRTPRGSGTRNLLPWLGVSMCALLTWPGHEPPYGLRSVVWFWQMALIVSGIMLAAGPLLADIRVGQTEFACAGRRGHPDGGVEDLGTGGNSADRGAPDRRLWAPRGISMFTRPRMVRGTPSMETSRSLLAGTSCPLVMPS